MFSTYLCSLIESVGATTTTYDVQASITQCNAHSAADTRSCNANDDIDGGDGDGGGDGGRDGGRDGGGDNGDGTDASGGDGDGTGDGAGDGAGDDE